MIALTDYDVNNQKPTPTIDRMISSCKKKGIPFYPVRLGEAFVIDSVLISV